MAQLNLDFRLVVWVNIHEPIFKYMANVREQRLIDERETAAVERLSLVNDIIKDFVTPHQSQEFILAVAVFIPEVYNQILIGAPEVDVPNLRRFLEDFMPTYLKKRDMEAKNWFIKHTRKRLQLAKSVDPFKLALAARFTCPHCHMSQLLSHALHHLCHSRFVSQPQPDWMSKDDYKFIKLAFSRLYWSYNIPMPTNILTADGTKQTEDVIKACGFDVKTATADELDKANVRLQCRSDSSEGPGTPIMNWRTAVRFSIILLSGLVAGQC